MHVFFYNKTLDTPITNEKVAKVEYTKVERVSNQMCQKSMFKTPYCYCNNFSMHSRASARFGWCMYLELGMWNQ